MTDTTNNDHKVNNKRVTDNSFNHARRYFIEGTLTDEKINQDPAGLNMNDYLLKLRHMADGSANIFQQPSPMATIKTFSHPAIIHPRLKLPVNNLLQKSLTQKAVAKHFVGGTGIWPSFGESKSFPWPSLKEHSFDDDKIKALGFHYGQDEAKHHESVDLGQVPSWTKCGMEHPCINYGRVAAVKNPKQIDVNLKSASFDSPPLEQFHVGFDHHYHDEHFVDLDHLLHNADEITHYVHDHDKDHDKMIQGDDGDDDERDSSHKKNPGYTIKHHWSNPILDIAHIERHDIRPDIVGTDTRTDFPPSAKEPKFAKEEEEKEEDENEEDPHFPYDHPQHEGDPHKGEHTEYPDNVEHLDHEEGDHGDGEIDHVDGYHMEEGHHSPYEPVHSNPAAQHHAGAGASGFHFEGYHGDHGHEGFHGVGHEGFHGGVEHLVGFHGTDGHVSFEHGDEGHDLIGHPSGHIEMGGADTFVNHNGHQGDGEGVGHAFGGHDVVGFGGHGFGGHDGAGFGGHGFNGHDGVGFSGDGFGGHSFNGHDGVGFGGHGFDGHDGTGFSGHNFDGHDGPGFGGHDFNGHDAVGFGIHDFDGHGGHGFSSHQGEDGHFEGASHHVGLGEIGTGYHLDANSGKGHHMGEVGHFGISHGHHSDGGIHITSDQNIYGVGGEGHTIHKGSSEAIHIDAEDSDDAKGLNKVLKTVNVHTDGHGHFYDESMHKAVDSTVEEDEKYGVNINKLVKASEDKTLAGIEKDADEAVKAEDKKLIEAPKKPKNDKEKFDSQLQALDESLNAGEPSPVKPDEKKDDSKDDDAKKKPIDVGGKGEMKSDDKLIQKIWAQIGGGEKPKKSQEIKGSQDDKDFNGKEIKPDDGDSVLELQHEDDLNKSTMKEKESEMEARVLSRISTKLGRGDSIRGAELLGKLLQGHPLESYQKDEKGTSTLTKNQQQEHESLIQQQQKGGEDATINQSFQPLDQQPLVQQQQQQQDASRKALVLNYQKDILFKMEAKILDGIALRLGQGDGQRGALMLSKLMNGDTPNYMDVQGSRKDELPTPTWYRFSNFVQEIQNGKSVRELLPTTTSISASADSQDGEGGSSWFPLTMFKGFDGTLKLPFLPYSITKDGQVNTEEDSSLSGASKKSGPYSMPPVHNPYGGMVFLARSQGSVKRGPYLVDHWGHAVDLSKRDFPGFLLTSRSSKKSYLYVPIKSMSQNSSSTDTDSTQWSNQTNVVLTPKGPMSFGKQCSTGNEYVEDDNDENKRSFVKNKRRNKKRLPLTRTDRLQARHRSYAPSGIFVPLSNIRRFSQNQRRGFVPLSNTGIFSQKRRRRIIPLRRRERLRQNKRRSFVPLRNTERILQRKRRSFRPLRHQNRFLRREFVPLSMETLSEGKRRSFVPLSNTERDLQDGLSIKEITHPRMIFTPSKDMTGVKRVNLFRTSPSDDVSPKRGGVLVPLNTSKKYKDTVIINNNNITNKKNGSNGTLNDSNTDLSTRVDEGKHNSGTLISTNKMSNGTLESIKTKDVLHNTKEQIPNSGTLISEMNSGTLDDRKKRQMHVHVTHGHQSFGMLQQDHPHFASDDFLNGSYVEAEPVHSNDQFMDGYSSFHDGSPEALYHGHHTYQGETKHIYQSDIGGGGHINYGNFGGHSSGFGGHGEEGVEDSGHHDENTEHAYENDSGHFDFGGHGASIDSEHTDGHETMEHGSDVENHSLVEAGHLSSNHDDVEHHNYGKGFDSRDSVTGGHVSQGYGHVSGYPLKGYGHITEDHPDFSHGSDHLTFTHGPIHSEVGNIGVTDYHGVDHETKGHYVSSLGGTSAHVGFDAANSHHGGGHHVYAQHLGEMVNHHAGETYHGNEHHGGEHVSLGLGNEHASFDFSHHGGGGIFSPHHHGDYLEEGAVGGGHHSFGGDFSLDHLGGGGFHHEDLSTPSGDMCLHEIQHHPHLGPMRLLPSHDGAMHLETPDIHINGPVHHEYTHVEVEEEKKPPDLKPGQTLKTPYGPMKLVPADGGDGGGGGGGGGGDKPAPAPAGDGKKSYLF